MELPAGKPHLLVSQDLVQAQPAWSPDGKWIAYVSWCDSVGGALWRVPVSGGTPEKLTAIPGQYQHPAWSPNGRSVAVIRGVPKLISYVDDDLPGQLEIISMDKGGAQIIADSISLWTPPTFAGDGKRIMYKPLHEGMIDGSTPLLVSNDLGGKDQQVLGTGISPAELFSQITLSPDGRYIVYSFGEDLYIVCVNDLQQTITLYNSQQSYAAIRFSRGVDPVWEKGGKILSWTYGSHFYRINPDKVMLAAAKRKTDGLPDSAAVTVGVRPDEDIPLRLSVPTRHAHGTVALEHARIITMQGNRVITNGTIVVKNGRILSAGPSNNTLVPKSAKILDMQGKTIIPGIIDLHLHLSMPMNIYLQQSWQLLANLAYGVTTARDPSTSIDSYGYEELVRSGNMTGPRVYSSGQAVAPITFGITKLDNLNDLRMIVAKRQELGGTFMKQYLMHTRLQRQWLLIASRQRGLNMTNEGDYNLMGNIAMIKDGSTGIEHYHEWGDIYNDMITLAVRSGTVFTPTLQVVTGRPLQMDNNNYLYWHTPNQKMQRLLPEEALKYLTDAKPLEKFDSTLLYPAKVFTRIVHAGGLIGLGSHGNNEGTGVHNELWALQSGGLTNMEALRAATLTGAKALGMQKDLGSIEAGKIADLVILNSNPLDDIHNSRDIKYVMKDGILYYGDTLDEIWPVYKKGPEWKFKGKTDPPSVPLKRAAENSDKDEDNQ